MVFYAPGQDFSIILQRLHNGKHRLDCFFPFCRFQTTHAIIWSCDKGCNSQDGLFPEHRDQVRYFCLKQDRIFVETLDFEFKRPLLSAMERGINGWLVEVTENKLYHKSWHEESSDSDDTVDSDEDHVDSIWSHHIPVLLHIAPDRLGPG